MFIITKLIWLDNINIFIESDNYSAEYVRCCLQFHAKCQQKFYQLLSLDQKSWHFQQEELNYSSKFTFIGSERYLNTVLLYVTIIYIQFSSSIWIFLKIFQWWYFWCDRFWIDRLFCSGKGQTVLKRIYKIFVNILMGILAVSTYTSYYSQVFRYDRILEIILSKKNFNKLEYIFTLIIV